MHSARCTPKYQSLPAAPLPRILPSTFRLDEADQPAPDEEEGVPCPPGTDEPDSPDRQKPGPIPAQHQKLLQQCYDGMTKLLNHAVTETGRTKSSIMSGFANRHGFSKVSANSWNKYQTVFRFNRVRERTRVGNSSAGVEECYKHLCMTMKSGHKEWIDIHWQMVMDQQRSAQSVLKRTKLFQKMCTDIERRAKSGHDESFEMVAIVVGASVNADGGLHKVIYSAGAEGFFQNLPITENTMVGLLRSHAYGKVSEITISRLEDYLVDRYPQLLPNANGTTKSEPHAVILPEAGSLDQLVRTFAAENPAIIAAAGLQTSSSKLGQVDGGKAEPEEDAAGELDVDLKDFTELKTQIHQWLIKEFGRVGCTFSATTFPWAKLQSSFIKNSLVLTGWPEGVPFPVGVGSDPTCHQPGGKKKQRLGPSRGGAAGKKSGAADATGIRGIGMAPLRKLADVCQDGANALRVHQAHTADDLEKGIHPWIIGADPLPGLGRRVLYNRSNAEPVCVRESNRSALPVVVSHSRHSHPDSHHPAKASAAERTPPTSSSSTSTPQLDVNPRSNVPLPSTSTRPHSDAPVSPSSGRASLAVESVKTKTTSTFGLGKIDEEPTPPSSPPRSFFTRPQSSFSSKPLSRHRIPLKRPNESTEESSTSQKRPRGASPATGSDLPSPPAIHPPSPSSPTPSTRPRPKPRPVGMHPVPKDPASNPLSTAAHPLSTAQFSRAPSGVKSSHSPPPDPFDLSYRRHPVHSSPADKMDIDDHGAGVVSLPNKTDDTTTSHSAAAASADHPQHPSKPSLPPTNFQMNPLSHALNVYPSRDPDAGTSRGHHNRPMGNAGTTMGSYPRTTFDTAQGSTTAGSDMGGSMNEMGGSGAASVDLRFMGGPLDSMNSHGVSGSDNLGSMEGQMSMSGMSGGGMMGGGMMGGSMMGHGAMMGGSMMGHGAMMGGSMMGGSMMGGSMMGGSMMGSGMNRGNDMNGSMMRLLNGGGSGMDNGGLMGTYDGATGVNGDGFEGAGAGMLPPGMTQAQLFNLAWQLKRMQNM